VNLPQASTNPRHDMVQIWGIGKIKFINEILLGNCLVNEMFCRYND